MGKKKGGHVIVSWFHSGHRFQTRFISVERIFCLIKKSLAWTRKVHRLFHISQGDCMLVRFRNLGPRNRVGAQGLLRKLLKLEMKLLRPDDDLSRPERRIHGDAKQPGDYETTVWGASGGGHVASSVP